MSLAEVIDDKDPEELSRVKVRLLPGMKDVEDDQLPWAEPINYLLGHSQTTGAHRPPEIGTQIFVIVAKRGTNFYYTHDAYVEGWSVYSNFPDVDLIDSQEYPQPRFNLYNDGSIHFINTETGEQGIITSTGTTIVIDASGSVKGDVAQDVELTIAGVLSATAEGDISVVGEGEISVDNGSGTITLKNSGQVDVNGNLTVDP
jgi:hypothetical protein